MNTQPSQSLAARATAVRPRVVIVGAGFGGLYAAKALRGAPVDVSVIDRRNHHLFQPLLYQVATAGLSPGDIAYPIRSIVSRQKNYRVLLAEAVGVDLAGRKVLLRDGAIGYDYLILAPGARHQYFGHDEWAPLAPGLNTLEDALEIRRRILLAFERAEREPEESRRRALLTFVIVGGGPTGVELAGAIAEIAFKVLVRDFRAIDPREAHIILLEAGPRLLPAFPESLSAHAAADLRRRGVEVRLNTAVTAIEAGRAQAGGQVIPTATTLWAAGVQVSALTRSLGVQLDRAGRVPVQPDLTLPGHPEVFVIGDSAAFTHQTGKLLPGVAQVAIQGGRHAARCIRRALRGQNYEPFHYVNLGNMATIGRASAVADFGFLRLSGFIAWMLWLVIHISWLIGFRNRFVVLFEWAWSYFTFDKAARLITGSLDDEWTGST
ncbi:MAG: NAD(P)/FAD-dependent oxidoreductase [Acidobacteriia bacterium]|nr:NAD(P)/FAD-dependent oxidoreductase [Terriglobia bacterium]